MGIAAVRARECPVVPRAAYPGRRLCMVPECRRRDRVAREPRAGNSQGKGLDRSRHGAPTTVAVWLQQRRRHGGQSVDRDAEAYAGLIMIGGCFAVEDDALPAGALAGKQVLVCRGRSDDIMPRHKFEQAESYLTGSSGARTTLLGYDGGHELPLTIKSSVQGWLSAADR